PLPWRRGVFRFSERVGMRVSDGNAHGPSARARVCAGERLRRREENGPMRRAQISKAKPAIHVEVPTRIFVPGSAPKPSRFDIIHSKKRYEWLMPISLSSVM